jgi:hypothetical protein
MAAFDSNRMGCRMDYISFAMGAVGLILAVAALPTVVRRLERRREVRHFNRQRVPDADASLSVMSPVEYLCRDRLYYHMDGWAKAVRLAGADDELIPMDRFEVSYVHTPLTIAPELRTARDDEVRRRLARANSGGKIFFDGPNTRLMQWRLSPREDPLVGREENVLKVDLGPVGWHDFEGLNGAFRARAKIEGLETLYEYYVGISSILRDGSVAESRLSNILDNAVTLVTSDGFVGYQIRSARVSLGEGSLTSSVAENTNRFLDDAEADAPLMLHNLKEGADGLSGDYRPRGVPHPVAAVLRGFSSEVSPEIGPYIGLNNLYVTGLSFDLEGLHPTLLFSAFTRLSHTEVLDMRRRSPGSEHIEGMIYFVPASFEHEETREILSRDGWIPSGQASLIRALEVIRGRSREFDAPSLEVISSLAAGHPIV